MILFITYLLIGIGILLIYQFIERQLTSPAPTVLGMNWKNLSTHWGDISYAVDGDGPPLLVLHGVGASSFSYVDLAPHLKGQYSLVFIDFPGHGKSSFNKKTHLKLENLAEICELILIHLKISEISTLGSSMGGIVALEISKRRKITVEKQVLLAPSTSPLQVPAVVKSILPFRRILALLGSILINRPAIIWSMRFVGIAHPPISNFIYPPIYTPTF